MRMARASFSSFAAGLVALALMIGAFIIHGITPGPNVLTDEPALFWGLIASMWIGNFLLLGGTLTLGLGVALLLTADLGSDGYSALVNGVTLSTGVPFVVTNTVVSLVFVLLAWLRGLRPGVGTVVQVAVVGVTVWLLLMGFAVVTPAVALISLGPRYISAPEVSLLMLLETVLGPLWVWLVISETPTPLAILGGSIVVTALIMHSAVGLRRVRERTA